jgi:hypothetical protein
VCARKGANVVVSDGARDVDHSPIASRVGLDVGLPKLPSFPPSSSIVECCNERLDTFGWDIGPRSIAMGAALVVQTHEVIGPGDSEARQNALGH